MQLIFEARGEQADQISYFLGKHPDNPYTKKTKYGVVEFQFLAYEKSYVKAFLSFKPNGLSLVRDSEYKSLEHYINDRESALSTIFLSNIRNSIGYVFSGGKKGIENPFSFNLILSPISTRLPDEAITELFEPLGYSTSIERMGNVINLNLETTMTIGMLFRQLFTLIPVMDNYKHYQIEQEDVDKLLRYGEGWLETHPKKEWITSRFVGYKKSLIKEALSGMTEETEEVSLPKQVRLGDLRYHTFSDYIHQHDISEVVDMGAGEGRLIELLVQNQKLTSLIACEPTESGLLKMRNSLEFWKRKKKVSILPEIIQSSLFYVDDRLIGKECITLCEVIEHIDKDRIDAVMEIVLGIYTPRVFLISTPNIEYNSVYEIERFRHRDHRFEMSRLEFQEFVSRHAIKYGYDVSFSGIGDHHPEFGQPTQLATITKKTI